MTLQKVCKADQNVDILVKVCLQFIKMYSNKFPEKKFGGNLNLIVMNYLLTEIAIIMKYNLKYVTMMMIMIFFNFSLININVKTLLMYFSCDKVN